MRRKVFDIRGMGKAKKEVDDLGRIFSRKIERLCRKKNDGAREVERKKQRKVLIF